MKDGQVRVNDSTWARTSYSLDDLQSLLLIFYQRRTLLSDLNKGFTEQAQTHPSNPPGSEEYMRICAPGLETANTDAVVWPKLNWKVLTIS